MNKLGDFDLKRGDWVKVKSRSWQEVLVVNESVETDKGLYTPNIINHYYVESVLRPSVVIRDHLDRYLNYARGYLGNAAHEYIAFEEVKPKEVKKSLFEKLKELDPILNDKNGEAVKFLCNEIEALQRQVKEKES